jgi:hypothetical protein
MITITYFHARYPKRHRKALVVWQQQHRSHHVRLALIEMSAFERSRRCGPCFGLQSRRMPRRVFPKHIAAQYWQCLPLDIVRRCARFSPLRPVFGAILGPDSSLQIGTLSCCTFSCWQYCDLPASVHFSPTIDRSVYLRMERYCCMS